MSVHFALSDVDPEFRPKKEVTRMGDSNFKPFSTHFLSKKRKIDELYDIETPASNLLMAVDILLDKFSDRGATIEDLTNTQEKLLQKLNKAKRKVEFLKTVLAKKSSHANEEGSDSRNAFLEEVKRDATIAVLESKIHMATEAAENGLDSSLWDVKAWKEKLARMKDNYITSPFSIGLGGCKVPKRRSTKAPKIKIFDGSSRGEASNSKSDENMAIADDPLISEGSSGEEGI